jgi:hypothetical protein
VAQLGARLDGIEEAVGSNPIGSTKSISNGTAPWFSASIFCEANPLADITLAKRKI